MVFIAGLPSSLLRGPRACECLEVSGWTTQTKQFLAELSKGVVEQGVQLKLEHAWLVCFSELPKIEAVSNAMDEWMYCWLAISRFKKIIQIGMTFATYPSSQMHILKKHLLTDIVWHETLAYML